LTHEIFGASDAPLQWACSYLRGVGKWPAAVGASHKVWFVPFLWRIGSQSSIWFFHFEESWACI